MEQKRELVVETTTTAPPASHAAQAESVIKRNMLYSMGVGLIPIPLVDFAGVTAVQINMINDLCRIYGSDFSRERAKSVIAALLGGLVPISIAGGVASVIKLVPVVGWTVGMFTMPLVAGASTYAIGRVFVQHFESGGTFLTFDPEAVRTAFRAEYAQGKKVAAELKR
jgi:uncharacterized protein (DUF697 family)